MRDGGSIKIPVRQWGDLGFHSTLHTATKMPSAGTRNRVATFYPSSIFSKGTVVPGLSILYLYTGRIRILEVEA
jgi:hypothetical protein